MDIPLSFLAYFVGFVDGDGYIQITKTTKGFIAVKMVISLHLNDISTLEYLKAGLKVGIISIHNDKHKPTCKLIINRTDLQCIVFPLMIYHNIFFLTKTRIEQFNLAMHILQEDIKYYDTINHKMIPVCFTQPETGLDYTKLSFFND
jgi:hypothetical protein